MLAVARPAVTMGAYTRLIDQPEALANLLEPIVGIPAKTLTQRLADRSSPYVEVARQLDPAVQRRIEREKIGVTRTGRKLLDFTLSERRDYPQGVGAQVVGFAGIDNQGIAGAESSLDRYLHATPGYKTVLRDRAGNQLRVLSVSPSTPGKEVRLTLDRDLQASVERTLVETVEKWKAKGATALVLDPHTGGILAMASAPGVPAKGGFAAATAEEQRLRSVTDQYEPGSTFKVVTMAAALSEGAVTPETRFDLNDTITLYDRTVEEAHYHGYVNWSVSDILAHSSNVGTLRIAIERLGAEKLSAWIKRLGFGKRTGIDLPGEVPGTVLPLEKWSGTSIINIPIGLGVAVTPLQLASVYAAVADGGVWTQPHILDAVDGAAPPKPVQKRILSRKVARQLHLMLQRVVSNDGSGALAAVPGYEVAGKTGTAPKINPATGNYCEPEECRLYHSSFVGYIPASDPQVVILVVVDEPDADLGYFGADVAAPAFAEIGKTAVQVLGIAPDAAG